MDRIGNIITSGKFNDYTELFNVMNNCECIDNGLPTLIIGWSNAKKYIDGVNILKKDYGNIHWTFSKTERRCDYNEDIISFYDNAIKTAMSKIKYTYVDIINYQPSSIKKLIRFGKETCKKIVFLTKNNNFMFVYAPKYNTVFGISLTLCEYLGIDKKKVIRCVKHGSFIHDTSFIDCNLRNVIGNNTHYILPLSEYFQK